jgi:hypothetical protein
MKKIAIAQITQALNTKNLQKTIRRKYELVDFGTYSLIL